MILELTKPEACKKLGCSPATLDRWIALGKVQARKADAVRAGKQGVIVVLELPEPTPQPKPTSANVELRALPEPLPEPEETPEQIFARRYLANEISDSFGNYRS